LAKNNNNKILNYSILTKIFKKECNLIKSFELPKFLNSFKKMNYPIQTHSKSVFIGRWGYFEGILILLRKFHCSDD